MYKYCVISNIVTFLLFYITYPYFQMIIVFNVKVCGSDLDDDEHAEITLLPSAHLSHLPGRVLHAGSSGAMVGGKQTR